jgi:hypothetical protein
MKAHQEKKEAAVHSIRSELEETIRHQVENIMMYVYQRTQGHSKELNEKIDETQVDLQLVMTYIDTSAGSLKDDITNTEKDCHQVIANTRKDLNEELGLMFHVEAQTTKALIKPTPCEFQTQLKGVEALAGAEEDRNRQGAEKPPKFDDTTSWAVFRRQFETVSEHNCWTRLEMSTYLITALQGRASDVLYGVPKGATYEETLDVLVYCFGDQHLAAAYPSQLNTRA